MMIAAASKTTKNIKLGSLTTNLNFYNPAVAAALISMVDNKTNGRLILGVGSGANMSDVEAMGNVGKDNRAISLEILELVKILLQEKNLVNLNLIILQYLQKIWKRNWIGIF